MEYGQASSGSGMHILGDVLIVPVKGELNDDSAKRLQSEILKKARATSVSGVLIDVSAVRVLDAFLFSILADTSRMLSFLGARPVFVGFQAGVASALIDLNVDLAHITTAVTMEDGFEILRSQTPRWRRIVQSEEEGLEDGAEEGRDESENDEVRNNDAADDE